MPHRRQRHWGGHAVALDLELDRLRVLREVGQGVAHALAFGRSPRGRLHDRPVQRQRPGLIAAFRPCGENVLACDRRVVQHAAVEEAVSHLRLETRCVAKPKQLGFYVRSR